MYPHHVNGYSILLALGFFALITAIRYGLGTYFKEDSKLWDWVVPPTYTWQGWYAYARKNPKIINNQIKLSLIAHVILLSLFLWWLSTLEEIDIGILYTWSIAPVSLWILSIPLWTRVKYPLLCIAGAMLYIVVAIGLLFVIQDLNSKGYRLPHIACKLVNNQPCKRGLFQQ